MSPILLDTCALLWVFANDPISRQAHEALDQSWSADQLTYVSPITAWEIGLLSSRGRMPTLMRPERWWRKAMQTPGLVLAQMPPDVLIASSLLPGAPPNDPADRIIAATAREFGLRLMTRDRRLLAYGEQGHLDTIAC